MLRFSESERPSFTELAKLVLTSTENTIESPKTGGQSAKQKQATLQTGKTAGLDSLKVNKVYSMKNFGNNEAFSISEKPASSKLQRKGTDHSMQQPTSQPMEDSQANLMT